MPPKDSKRSTALARFYLEHQCARTRLFGSETRNDSIWEFRDPRTAPASSDGCSALNGQPAVRRQMAGNGPNRMAELCRNAHPCGISRWGDARREDRKGIEEYAQFHVYSNSLENRGLFRSRKFVVLTSKARRWERTLLLRKEP